jgi:hypothetical protein
VGLAAEDEDGSVPSFAHVSGEEGYIVLETAVFEGMDREYLKNRHIILSPNPDLPVFCGLGIIGAVSSGPYNF